MDFIRAGRLPQKYSQENMVGKICIIPGATSGVGYEACIQLEKVGATLVFIVRSKEKAEQLSAKIQDLTGSKPRYYIADFADLNQLTQATEEILEEYSKIDVLINNVGLHMTTRQLTKGGHEMAFCVNHLASFLIASLLIKRMVDIPLRMIHIIRGEKPGLWDILVLAIICFQIMNNRINP